MADKFRTQDTPLTGRVSYMLSMPDALWFISEVSDLLFDMVNPGNWERDGAVTIEQATNAATEMYMSFAPMIGQIAAYITSSPPSNCLPCDGATYNRVDYPDLYAALDAAFQVDADTFIVPDLRGKTVIGVSVDYAVNASGGEKEHTLTSGEMPAHTHTDTGHLHTTGNSLSSLAVMPGEGPVLVPNPLPAWTGSASANLANTGGGSAHNNMQPYVALKYAVVAR